MDRVNERQLRTRKWRSWRDLYLGREREPLMCHRTLQSERNRGPGRGRSSRRAYEGGGPAQTGFWNNSISMNRTHVVSLVYRQAILSGVV